MIKNISFVVKSPFLFVYIPLLTLALVGYFFIIPIETLLKEFINFGLITLIGQSLFFLIYSNVIRKWFLAFFISILHLLVFIKLSFYINYGVRLNASAFYLIFETNKKESIGFLDVYLTSSVTLLLVFVTISLLLFIVFFSKNDASKFNLEIFKNKKTRISFFTIAILLSVGTIYVKFQRFNLFVSSVVAYKEYKSYKNLSKDNLSKPFSNNLKVDNNASNSHTSVVIIGESTSSWHMQLYGYERETNPRLKEVSDQLYIFKDVIAPNVHTILSLDKILTFSDYLNSNKKNNASVVQLANMAGFETYWLSNQKATGLHESVATVIGSAAHNTYFLAGDGDSATIYDEIIFNKLEEILKDGGSQKVIFIHLMGTHSRYNYRYPKDFDVFTKDNYEEGSLFKKSNQEVIDYYDNAVLYNDYIVRNIIDMVKKIADDSSVIYFSDHGDDVYDTSYDSVGHDEFNATRPMYEVPFLLWLSPKHSLKINSSEIRGYLDRKYNLEDFEHTFTDLLGISHNLYEPNKSIISSNFIEKTRLVREGIDYDKEEE